jgi:hypothetical protein
MVRATLCNVQQGRWMTVERADDETEDSFLARVRALRSVQGTLFGIKCRSRRAKMTRHKRHGHELARAVWRVAFRDPRLWLTDKMQQRAIEIPVLMGHPEPPVEYSGLAQQRRRAELDAAEEAERITAPIAGTAGAASASVRAGTASRISF